MAPWTVTVRATDGAETSVSFEAQSRDEALFAAGIYYGANYSERWTLVRVDAGWDVF